MISSDFVMWVNVWPLATLKHEFYFWRKEWSHRRFNFSFCLLCFLGGFLGTRRDGSWISTGTCVSIWTFSFSILLKLLWKATAIFLQADIFKRHNWGCDQQLDFNSCLFRKQRIQLIFSCTKVKSWLVYKNAVTKHCSDSKGVKTFTLDVWTCFSTVF